MEEFAIRVLYTVNTRVLYKSAIDVWWNVCIGSYFSTSLRGVAQPGRAPRSGRGGRRFKSSRPDQ